MDVEGERLPAQDDPGIEAGHRARPPKEAPAQGHQDDDRDEQQHDAQCDGLRAVRIEGRVDGERHGPGHPGELPANFAGSFPGVTRTLPLAVYAALDVDRSEAIALSVVLLLVSVAILVALRGQFLNGLRR